MGDSLNCVTFRLNDICEDLKRIRITRRVDDRSSVTVIFPLLTVTEIFSLVFDNEQIFGCEDVVTVAIKFFTAAVNYIDVVFSDFLSPERFDLLTVVAGQFVNGFKEHIRLFRS